MEEFQGSIIAILDDLGDFLDDKHKMALAIMKRINNGTAKPQTKQELEMYAAGFYSGMNQLLSMVENGLTDKFKKQTERMQRKIERFHNQDIINDELNWDAIMG